MGEKVKLGSKYRDKLYGTEGIATSRTEYVSGCARVSLGYVNKDEEVKTRVFDEPLLELVAEKKLGQEVTETRDRGGPGEVPPDKVCPTR